MFEATIPLSNLDDVLPLFGPRDQHLRAIRDALDVHVSHRDNELRISGEETKVAQATEAIVSLKDFVEKHGRLSTEEVQRTIDRLTGAPESFSQGPLDILASGRQIRPRTAGQSRYVSAIREYDLVFTIGPSGTGKTYLAVAAAVEALKNKQIRKIVLVRPAVEAGESLGFLPGDLQAKINPYLRPLLDALYEMIDYDQISRFREQDLIEVIPLAYMRGRTLNEAFIILDEAQNTTISQMKMFLTRMGAGSKIVVCGDTTQTDLPPHTRSGLVDALHRLAGIDGFCEVKLTKADIVRHRLVQAIVRAYEEQPKRKK
jgi:phosphate starvation-inducible PhoH-like protein